ncbi:amino acid synthesis family protein [Sporomusa aerivorans]|uniref:amino acid synthesis family protein n=1 Tax=Sporomusa aerivorans TaxID=204936 RepID=UPI00352A1BDF
MDLTIRKIVTVVEEVRMDGKKAVDKPFKKCAAVAVIKNPFAGEYQEDLTLLTDAGEYLGGLLAQKAVDAMGIAPAQAESYGKGAIIGLAGELEHGAAILHPKLGKPMREAVNGGKAIIPSAKKLGGAGTPLDVPLHYKDAAFVRTHYDAMEVRLHDAPAADEIVVAVVVTSGGRPHPRIGGLQVQEVKGEDGLR